MKKNTLHISNMQQPLVSIVIPTFNRGHLISETLDSILAQTYINWECIVVDDGSEDDTSVVLYNYVNKDNRIQYHHRPKKYSSGGNGARNYGLDLAKGEYIIFFDSDDLMLAEHIETKLTSILTSNSDYVIAKTKYFNTNISLEGYYSFDKYEITLENYIFEKINWLTYDTLIVSELAKKLSFNEKLKSGQEYNFHSKLVSRSTNALFIDKILTLRRHHENSIRTNLKSKESQVADVFYKKFYTYQDIGNKLNYYKRKDYFLICVDKAFKSKKIFKKELFKITYHACREFKFYGIFIVLIYISKSLFNKDYTLKKIFYKITNK